MKKKVLIHSLIFSPDGVSTAYLYNDIALSLKNAGYDVVVLTTTPHYNIVEEQLAQQPLRWKIWGICKQSDFCGIPVIHIPQKKFKSTLLRLIGFVYWHIISLFVGLSIKNIDVILSPSPPLTIGFLNILIGKLKRAKVIYNVQEIYPDILGKKSGPVYWLLSRMERFVYNKSDATVTIDKVFYDTIVGRFDNPEKLHIIPNFVDTDLYNSSERKELLDSSLFPQSDSVKLLYAGNIGFAQDWEPLVELAERTKELDIDYFVIGEGVMKGYLEQQKSARQLDRLHILPYQPRQLMPAILNYSDIEFIFMNPEMDMQGFPSKVYTIMACERPLLVCSGENTPIVNFLRPCHCGKLITERDKSLKVEQMYQWLKSVSRAELVQMGKNGLQEIQAKYTKNIVTKQYIDLVNRVL